MGPLSQSTVFAYIIVNQVNTALYLLYRLVSSKVFSTLRKGISFIRNTLPIVEMFTGNFNYLQIAELFSKQNNSSLMKKPSEFQKKIDFILLIHFHITITKFCNDLHNIQSPSTHYNFRKLSTYWLLCGTWPLLRLSNGWGSPLCWWTLYALWSQSRLSRRKWWAWRSLW